MSFLESMTEELRRKIEFQKTEILADKLKELGIELDIKEELKKPFPKIRMEVRDSEESFFFDDGTNEGKRIVTFVQRPPEVITNLHQSNFNVEISYY